MNQKVILFVLGICLMSIVFISCGSRHKKLDNTDLEKEKAAAEEQMNTPTDLLVGDDRDEFGCINTAGYQWSKLKKECVRIFEIGIPLQNALIVNAPTIAFVIEGDAQVEVFLPDLTAGILLDKSGDVWSNQDFTLSINNTYELSDKTGTILFKQD